MRLYCGGGSVLGAVGGFLVGGPVGALIGAGLGASYDSSKAQAKATKKASAQAADAANAQATQAERAYNKANAKKPDIAGIDAANQLEASGGTGSTMLTGPGGVDPTSLSLGKTTLLGGA